LLAPLAVDRALESAYFVSLGYVKRVPSLLLSTAARNPQGTSLAAFDVQRQLVFMKSAQE
jgi:hypothetical protein